MLRRIVSSLVVLFSLALVSVSASAQTTYTWNQTATASWATAANWTPTRTTPAANDVLVFNNAATTTATNVPTQTIGQLSVSGNTNVTLQAAAAVAVTIAGGTGTDLSVAGGSQLNVSGASVITLGVGTGATGSISGAMTLAGAAHRLTSVDASGITFQSGAVFTAGTAFAGNAFGTTSLNSVIFASGSTYVAIAGANPFGATAPNSVVVFQTGSLFKSQGSAPAFSGRTYANFELVSGTQSVTGGAASSVDNITVTAGTLNYGMTGVTGHAIKGNISVAASATLNFNPASAATVNFNGSTPQSITNAGTLTLNDADQTYNINNANGLTLNSNVTVGLGVLTLSTGTITTGANTLTIGSGTTVSRTSGYVIGNLRKDFAANGSKVFEVGTANGYSPFTANVTAGTPGNITCTAVQGPQPNMNPATSIQRYWILGATAGITADLTFQYLLGDVMGNEAAYKVFRVSGGIPVSFPASVVTPATHIATLAGVSSFSDWTVGEDADVTPPVVTSVTVPANGTYIAGQNLDFTVNFSEIVLVTTGGGTPRIPITLNTGGTVYAAYVSGSGSTALLFRYTVVGGNNDPDGISVGASFETNGGTIKDAAGNDANPTLNGVGSTTGVLVDTTAPAVQSIVRANTDPTSAASVDFTVTFTESVLNVGTNDFTLTTTGVSGPSITGVVGTGSGPYTVSVNTGTGSGTIRLDAIDNATITDVGGNPFTTGFITGEVYTVDKSAPSVLSINRVDTNPTNATDVDFTVTFDVAVTGVDASDFALALTGVTGTINTPTGGGTTWNVNVSGVTGNGTLGLNLVDDDTIVNGTLVPLGGVGAGNGNFTGHVYTIDQTAPAVLSSVRANSNPTNAASRDFTVTFSETVSGVDTTNFTLTTTGGIAGASVSGVSGTGPYTVSVNTGTGDGTIRLDFVDNNSVTDTAGNPTATGFTTGEAYTIDKTAPSVVSILRASTNPTPGPSVDYTVTFNENVSGVGTADFTIFTTGAISGTSVTLVAGGPMVYTVTVNTGSNSGTLRLDVTDDDTILDAVTNRLGGTGAGNGNFNTGEVYTVNAPTPAPTGLVAAVSSAKVTLTWNAVPGATSYTVKRALVSGGPYGTIATPATNSHNDLTVVNGTRYYYVVTATAPPGGESVNSAEVHAKPDVAAALGIDISQVYGGGGNSGAPFTNDFIELFNRGNSTVDMTGWSVQYASAAGSAWTPTNISGNLAPGQHFLVHEGGGVTGAPLPTADATGAILMSATAGKVVLVSSTTALSGTCPSGAAGLLDMAGYGGTASCFEGAGATPAPSNTNAVHRASNGCVDTNNNTGDFTAATPTPRNKVAAFTPCTLTAIGSSVPTSVPSGNSVLLLVELPPATVGGVVTGNLTSIGGVAAQPFFDNATNGDVTAGDNIFSFQATATASSGLKSIGVSATNLAAQNAATTIPLTIDPALETIAAIKVDTTPADTVPDRLGQAVLTKGVVTSIDFRGGTGVEYYIQDATGGIDVFSSSDFGPFAVGAAVQVSGTVTQFSGLTELSPISMSAVAPLPAITPQVVTLSAINESLEGTLIRVNGLTMASTTFAGDTNYAISDGSAGTLRVDIDTDIDGTSSPTTTFSLIGLVGQFDNTNPFDSGYQIIPRSTADIIPNLPPTGVGGANPPSVAPGGVSLLTVTVTPGQNPASTGIVVVANLSSIGLSASQAFLDDGTTNGDVTNGDGVYSYSATVNGATSLGMKSLPVSISDAQARNSATSISLNIQSASAPPVPVNVVATAGDAQVGLTWNPSAGATGYNVKRSLVSGGPYSTIAPNIPAANYTDNTVTNGLTYYYVISALNGVDESGDSNQVSATPQAPPPAGPLAKIYFVDIGQGAGTLIVGPTGKSLLVDGGPNGEGNTKIIPLLNSLGITTIDYTIVTHYHIDHDGGMTEVIQAGRLDNGIAYDNGDLPHVVPPVPSNGTGVAFTAYKNAITARGNVTRTQLIPGTVIDLGGGMRATCLAAGGALASGGNVYVSGTDLNSSSISVLIEFNDFDYLVSGDLTGGGQTTTAKTPDIESFVAQMAGDVDVVQLDHHGSTTANNRRFLGKLKAEISFASVGTSNTFGHPNRETVNRYLNIPVTSGNTFGGEGVPPPGNGPVHYQTEASPPTDNRTSVQFQSGASAADAGEGTLLLETDGLVSFTMKSFDDSGVRISPTSHIYALDGQGLGITTNFPPTVIPYILPGAPLSTDVVTVTALVNDREDAITSVTLNYSLNGAAQAPVVMTPTVGSEFAATIPAQPNGTRVDYTVTGVAGGASTSYVGGYYAGTTTIATLRSITALGEPTYLDYVARISGLVTSGTGNYSTTNNDDYIDDGTGALNISRTIEPDTPATQPTTAGNTYTVAGFINQLTGKFRLDVTPPFDGVDKPWAATPGSFNPFGITLTGSAAVTPLSRTIAQITADGEGNEAKLVTISNCTVVSGTIPGSGTIDAYLVINDGTGTMEMKIDGDSDIIGLATPVGVFTVIGTVQQDDFLRPFNTRYTIAPRDRTDLGGSGGGPSLITIAEARIDEDPSTFASPDDFIPDLLGQQVKIRGVVTSVDFRGASGTEIYIQDPTGGVDIFSTTINTVFNIGDNLEVVGTVAQFNGLTEITPSGAADITLLAPGTLPPVSLEVVTLSQLADSGVGEAYEGRLIRVNNVTLTSPPALFAANTNYNITDATGGPVQMRIDSDTNIDGTAPPASPFSVIGVLGQFDSGANPDDAGYQLFPLTTSSFSAATATPANITATAGTPQSTTTNTPFATLLQATVTDAGAAPIEGIGVTFTAPAAGASGTFANATNTTSTTTNASGVATATVFTANSVPGGYVVTATTDALTANFNLTNLAPDADLSVTKSDAPDPVVAGNNLTYTVTFTNNGPSSADNVTVTDAVPANTTFVSAAVTIGTGWGTAAPSVGGTGNVVFSKALVANGETATFTIVVNVNSGTASGTVIANTATAASTTNDPNGGNSSATANTTVSTQANLSVTKGDAPDPVLAGGNITYTINFTNNGPSSAQTVTVTDAVPTNTTFVSAAVTIGSGWGTAAPGVGGTGNVIFSKGTVAAGETATFTIVVNVNGATANGTVITNSATAASTTTDPNGGDNTATTTTTVTVLSADLSVTKTDSPDPVVAGTNLTYTVTFTNNGPSSADNVTVTDAVPAGTTFVSAAVNIGTGWGTAAPAVGGTGNVVFSKALVANGETATFTIVVNVNSGFAPGTSFNNTATAASTTNDPAGGNNSATANTFVNAQADKSVTIADSPDPVFAGSNITYTINFVNNGPSDADTVGVTANIGSPNVTLVSAVVTTGTGWTMPPAAPGLVIFGKGMVASGETAVFTIVVNVNPGTAAGTVISSLVGTGAGTIDPNSGNDLSTTTTTVTALSADLLVTVTDSPDPVNAGSDVQYILTVTDTATDAAPNAGLSDTLPPNTTFVSLAPQAGWSCTTPAVGGTGTVNCSIASLAVGSPATFVLTVKVDTDAGANAVISNTATASSDAADPVPANNSDTENTTVLSPATVTATKTAAGTFQPGTNVTYTITLSNSGPADQSNNPGDEFTDVLPSQLTLISANASSGIPFANLGTNTVTWNGVIPAGGSVTITIVALVEVNAPVGSTVTNQGTFSYDADGNGTNETAGVTDDPSQPGSGNGTGFVVGAAAANDIPALDPRSLIVLATLLAAIGVLIARRS